MKALPERARTWHVGDQRTRLELDQKTRSAPPGLRETGWRSAPPTLGRPPLAGDRLAQLAGQTAGYRSQAPGDTGEATIAPAEPRDPQCSLGIVGCVDLDIPTGRAPGVLAMRLESEGRPHVDLATVRVFRWRDDLERYECIPDSGVDGETAWAMVTVSGQYVAAGLPQDERLRSFFDAWAALAKHMDHLQPAEQSARRADLHRAATGTPPTEAVQQLRPAPLELSISLAASGVQGWYARNPWESLGPHTISGPVHDLTICPGRETLLYAACGGGGLWRASEFRPREAWSGWEPLTDDLPDFAPDAVAVDYSRPARVYAGLDSGLIARSDDAGRTWDYPGDFRFGTVHRVVVHPTEPGTVLVAASSIPMQPTRAGGLWLSTTGGRSWGTPVRSIRGGWGSSALLAGDVTDVVLVRSEPRIMYAAVRGEGIYKTANFGGRWALVLPWSIATDWTSDMMKLAVGGEATDANRTVVAKLDRQVFLHLGGEPEDRWHPAGRLRPPPDTPMGDWVHALAVDPNDSQRFLAGLEDLELTTSGGRTWTWVAGYNGVAHPDIHCVVFDPADAGRVYAGTDGGVWVSTDGGQTWQDRNGGLATTAMYQVGLSGDAAVAGTYHWGILATHSTSESWQPVEGGGWEFTRQAGDPSVDGRFYVLGGLLATYDYRRGESNRFNLKYATFGTMQVLADWRASSDTLLVATPDGRLMRTLERYSDRPSWAQEAGITLDASQHDIIIGLAMAPRPTDPVIRVGPGWAYAVSAMGHVFTKDEITAASPWRQVGRWAATLGDPADFRRTLGNRVAVNAVSRDRLYLISRDSFARSEDGGQRWRVANGTGRTTLRGDPRSLAAHPSDGRTVYVSTNGDIYVSHDEGDSWASFRGNLPHCEVDFLEVHGGWLYASTYGRGLWRRRI